MPAPKGHTFSVGNNGGRPRVYDKPEEMVSACDAYFNHVIENKEPATVTGLALWLGFESRQSLYDYGDNEKFSYIIRRARTIVEHEYEKKLSSVAVGGAIFALKNMGWVDKQVTEHEGIPENVAPSPIVVYRDGAPSLGESPDE
jgi:hypothetical protein